jgi:hypothetical protein
VARGDGSVLIGDAHQLSPVDCRVADARRDPAAGRLCQRMIHLRGAFRRDRPRQATSRPPRGAQRRRADDDHRRWPPAPWSPGAARARRAAQPSTAGPRTGACVQRDGERLRQPWAVPGHDGRGLALWRNLMIPSPEGAPPGTSAARCADPPAAPPPARRVGLSRRPSAARRQAVAATSPRPGPDGHPRHTPGDRGRISDRRRAHRRVRPGHQRDRARLGRPDRERPDRDRPPRRAAPRPPPRPVRKDPPWLYVTVPPPAVLGARRARAEVFSWIEDTGAGCSRPGK